MGKDSKVKTIANASSFFFFLDYHLPYIKKYKYRLAATAKSLQSCLTVQPHRRQPTRLPHPWDSPGKNTGVGYHFLLQCMQVKNESEVSQSCPTLSDPRLQPTGLLCPWDFPGKSTGVGCHHLLRIQTSGFLKLQLGGINQIFGDWQYVIWNIFTR